MFLQRLYVNKEGLGTQNQLPAYFSPFTLNNIPLKLTYWANRLNGDSTTGDIDPYTVANDLKTTSRTLNIVLYGDENGVNQTMVGRMSALPFTVNNLPFKMLTWANRLNGDSTGGTVDPQTIAHELQYSSFLLNQLLTGGDTNISIPAFTPTPTPSYEAKEDNVVYQIYSTTPYSISTTPAPDTGNVVEEDTTIGNIDTGNIDTGNIDTANTIGDNIIGNVFGGNLYGSSITFGSSVTISGNLYSGNMSSGNSVPTTTYVPTVTSKSDSTTAYTYTPATSGLQTTYSSI